MNTEFYPLEISELERLTREAVAIRFTVPEHLKTRFQFHQGQHIIIKTQIDGQEIRRSYSICGNVQHQELQIAIKRIPDGIFSNYANDHLQPGMSLEIMPPQGHFYTELDEDQEKHYLCIAAGSGITPILSHIRSILSIESRSRVSLIYANKSTTLMMFRNKLSFTKNQYMDRFQWVNLFTSEQQDAEIFNGRISADKLTQLNEKHVIQLKEIDEAFLCGPEEMIKEIMPFLESQGLTDNHIHYELFFADSAEKNMLKKQQQRSEQFDKEVSRVTVKLSGRKTSFDLPLGGANILDAALEEGADLPFSCKVGVCAACKSKLVKGSVDMDENHALTEDEVADGMILTCQSHPTSKAVEIDFDVN